MVCSKASRGKGSTPLPAIAPNSTALNTVPVSPATAVMSKMRARRLFASTVRNRSADGARPSDICIFSAVVSVRELEVTTSVRSAEAMPLPMWRTVSSSSEETSTSSAPGTGYRLNTGLRPARSASGTGNTSK